MTRKEILESLKNGCVFSGGPYCWFGLDKQDTETNIVKSVGTHDNSLEVELYSHGTLCLKEIWNLDTFIMAWLQNKRVLL